MTSPAIDFEAICDALASRFVAATLGTPGGLTPIRKSYSETPKGIAALPAHYLEVREGSIVANSRWEHEISVDGVLVIAKRQGDTARTETTRRKWPPYLLHATVDALKIGIAPGAYEVAKALPSGWEWDEVDVGGTEYDAIRVHWTLYLYETVSLTP